MTSFAHDDDGVRAEPGDTSETYDLFQQGRSHLRSGRPSQAAVALEKAKRREPEKASIREALGIAYFRVRRWAEAEAEFRKLVELSPVDPFAHQALARTLDRLGRAEDAAQHHALARALQPTGSDERR
jgi:Flp pilus assembly protein TadD